MKKNIFTIIFILLLIPFTLLSQTYEIETSREVVTFTIPEEYTLEQTLIEVVGLYLEERYDLEELLEDHTALIQQTESYKALAEDYRQQVNQLISDYDELMALYQKKQRLTNFLFLPTAGLDYSIDNGIQGKFGFGLLLFQRAFIQLELGYPYEIGFTIGWKLF